MAITTHIAVSVALSDAGEATRSLALARALRDRCPTGLEVRITFVSNGSRFEPMIEQAGFPIVACQPRVKGNSIAEDLQWEFPHLVGSAELARSFIEGQLAIQRELRPDVVLHGMWPFANLAARMLGIPTVCFLPLPLHPSTVGGGMLDDLPDTAPVVTRLPRPVRKRIARVVSPFMVHVGIFRQRRLSEGAIACGWPADRPLTFFDVLHADLTLVNDLPQFHAGLKLPPSFTITGPVFADDHAAAHDGGAELDPQIEALLHRDGHPGIVLTMGSSGGVDDFLAAVRALIQDDWNVLVLASPAVCPLERARAAVGSNLRVLVTDRFVPAFQAHRLADVSVSHGGQGTVQTIMAAGTPLVGVGMQMEQQINLDHVMDAGAGIRIQRQHWRTPVIRRAVQTVLADPSYKRNAEALAATIATMDGAATAADRMWRFLVERQPGEAPTAARQG